MTTIEQLLAWVREMLPNGVQGATDDDITESVCTAMMEAEEAGETLPADIYNTLRAALLQK